MRLFLMLQMALRHVFRSRRRSVFALLTISIGAVGLFLFMGFNGGLMNQYRANTIRARYGHGELSTKGYRGAAHARPWELWVTDARGVAERLKAIPGVRAVFPRLTFGSMLIHEETMLVAVGEGIDGVAEAAFFDQLNYVAGGDFKDRPDTIVLGKGLALGLGAKVGDTVSIYARNSRSEMNLKEVTVTGIFYTGIPAFDDGAFRCPLAVAQEVVDTRAVERFAVALTNDEGWPAFAQAAALKLPELEAVPFDVLDEVYYKHGVDFLNAQFDIIRFIILLVVFLGIFNLISMAVVERTGEIGILRANGDSRLDVALGQIMEAFTLGLLGGLLGILLGWLLTISVLSTGVPMPPAPGISRSFRILIELTAADAVHVVMLCTLTAVAGCVLPVFRATRMPIAQALRHA